MPVLVQRGGKSPDRKASPRRSAPSRQEESSIRRGAQIIRRQIQSQIAELGEKLQPPVSTSANQKRQHQQRQQQSNLNDTSATSNVTGPHPATSQQQRQDPPASVRHSNVGKSSLNLAEPLNQTRSGDNFSDFSDPWKRESTGKRLSTARRTTSPPSTGKKALLRSYPVTMLVDADNDGNDSSSDINTVSEPMFDPFAERDLIPPCWQKQNPILASSKPSQTKTPTPSSSNSKTPAQQKQQIYSPPIVSPDLDSETNSQYLSSPSESDIFTFDDGSRKAVAVIPASPDREMSSCSTSSSSSAEYRQRQQQQLQQPQQSQYPQITPVTSPYEEHDTTSLKARQLSPSTQQQRTTTYLPPGLSPVKGGQINNINNLSLTALHQRRPSLYQSSDSDDDNPYNDEEEDDCLSPMKQKNSDNRPVRAVVESSPGGIISQITTPNKDKPRYLQTSTMLRRYRALLESAAYQHAANAGFLWQSIVGQHVRFPENWWDGERGPPLGCGAGVLAADHNDSDTPSKWMYLNRQTVRRNPILNQLVKCRASGGRLLLHIIVQDLMTRSPVQDVVIGCFHPNAKGIRDTDRALGRLEDCRDVWIAIRKRSSIAVSAVDSLLYNVNDDWLGGRDCDDWVGSRSPLGHARRVTNANVRSVFGERPPLETIFVSEDELYERLSERILHGPDDAEVVTPAMAILQEFVFA